MSKKTTNFLTTTFGDKLWTQINHEQDIILDREKILILENLIDILRKNELVYIKMKDAKLYAEIMELKKSMETE